MRLDSGARNLNTREPKLIVYLAMTINRAGVLGDVLPSALNAYPL